MGRMLVQAIHEQKGCYLAAASEQPGSQWIGQDAGEVAGVGTLGVPIRAEAGILYAPGRIIIDFTTPQATLDHIQRAIKHQTPMVIGTTGLDADDLAYIKSAAASLPIVFAPNFSVGINLMFKVAAEVAAVLKDAFDVEIIEAHHRHKVDAPSGTALKLGQTVASALGRNLSDVAVYGREGHTGARDRATIGFSTVRGGDIVGDHTVLFAGDGERFEVTHKASSRMTFAKGAVVAAQWVAQQNSGLYDMMDVLGFKATNG